MSRILPALISFLLVFSTIVIISSDSSGSIPIPAASGFSGGSGTESDPYQISNVTQLQNMSSDLDAHYVLVNDIDASATSTWNWDGTKYLGFIPVGNDTDQNQFYFQGTEFTGSLNGNGYNITDLFIDRIDTDYIGLFGRIGDGGEVTNISMINFDLTGGDYIGCVAGENQGGIIHNCNTDGNSTGYQTDYFDSIYHVGGLVGSNNGEIFDCCSAGNVTGQGRTMYNIGAFVGSNSGNITGSISHGKATGPGENTYRVGGFVGYNIDGMITNCHSSGKTTGSTTSAYGRMYYVGGFAGTNEGEIEKCHNSGDTTGSSALTLLYVGGFVGYSKGDITDSYSEGNVSCGQVYGAYTGSMGSLGGFAGRNEKDITDCFSKGWINVTGTNNVNIGGFLGENLGTTISSYGIGDVSITNNGDYRTSNVGGFAGSSQGPDIAKCYSKGDVSVTSSAYYSYSIFENFGGFLGLNAEGNITDCFSRGDTAVSVWSSYASLSDIGGFTGHNDGNLENSYSTGSASGSGAGGATDVGGFCGENTDTISNCFWDTTTSGTTTGVGTGTATGVTGRTTTQLMTKTTFTNAGWDFNYIWSIVDGSEYPHLGVFDINYAIMNVFDLHNMRYDVDGNFILGADINASATRTWNSGAGFLPIGDSSTRFAGTFDGRGYKISGLFINRTLDRDVGLFGSTGTDFRGENVILENATVNGDKNVGGLVGDNRGLVSNCSVDGKISVFDPALELEASDEDYVDFGTMSGFMKDTSWSIIEKVKIPEDANRIGGWHMFRGSGWNDKQGDVAFQLRTDTTTGNVYVWLNKGGWKSLTMDNGNNGIYIGKGVWYTICLVYDSSDDEYRLYVNGTLVDSDSTIGAMDDSSNTNDLYFGGQQVDPMYVRGDIYSEVDITFAHHAWLQRELSTSEISTYDGWLDPATDDLYLSTKIETDGISDLSGNGRDGTFGNSPFPYGAPSNITDSTDNIGGISGLNSGNIMNCTSEGSVFGSYNTGGITGYNLKGNISECDVLTDVVNDMEASGGIAGSNSGSVDLCISSSNIRGAFNVGGLVGCNTGTISNSKSSGSVNATDDQIGGVAGESNGGTVANCESSGNVSGLNRVGGTVGYNTGDAKVTECTSTCHIIGNDYVGGITGHNYESGVLDCNDSGNIEGENSTGGIAGYNNEAIIKNCSSNSTINGIDMVGGIAGQAYHGTISGCISSSKVNGSQNIGGIVGTNTRSYHSSEVSNCTNLGDVVGTGYYVGGLIGENDGSVSDCMSEGMATGERNVGGSIGSNTGEVTRSFSTGKANSTGSNGDYAGGFAGYNDGTISQCFSTGDAIGTDDGIGGFVGENAGTISNCYSTGYALGAGSGSDHIGGFSGLNDGTITDCYSIGNASGNINVGGFSGSNSGTIIDCFFDNYTSGMNTTAGGTGNHTRDMKTMETFANWSLDDIWWMFDNRTYPFFKWMTPGPYPIHNLTDLQNIGYDLDGQFYMIHDLDASETHQWSGGFDPIGDWFNRFVGNFDGNGYNITDLFINRTSSGNNGLFAAIYQTGHVHDLDLVDAQIHGGGYRTAILAGSNIQSTVENCSATGTVYGKNMTGGLVGDNFQGTIKASHVEVKVTGGHMKVGGLTGENSYGTVENCYSEGNVKAEDLYIGGLVGDGGSGTIFNSFSTADVWGESEVGGLVGRNMGNMEECYSTGNVNSTGTNTGGLVGENFHGTIKNCYSTSDVLGNISVGGFCGKNNVMSDIENCYSAGSVNGLSNIGGFCGSNQDTVTDCFYDNITSGTTSSSGGTGKSTSEMMIKDTFSDAGWDFSIWNIVEGRTYPYLDDFEYPDPVIVTENVVDAYEDTFYSIQYVSSSDLPGHSHCTWTLTTDAAWLTMHTNGTLSGTPENSHVGSYHVKVTCTDARQVSTSTEFDLTVHNTNDAPIITSTPGGNATEDLLYSTQFKASDIDPTNDTLTWSMVEGPDWLTMDSGTGWLNGTPTNDDVGTHVVNISVSDGNGGSDWTRFTITVENTNDDPKITTSPQGSVNEDSVYSIYLEAEDIDPVSTSFFWSMETDASWLALTGNHLHGNPKNGDVGSYWVNISVRGSDGGSDWLNFTVSVINTNDNPIFTFTPDTTATEDLLYSSLLSAVDPDPTSDDLIWALETGPDWLSIDSSTGWLNGTPENDDVGSHNINVSVRDGNGGLDWKEFTIVVSNTNDDPEITTRTPPSTVNEDTEYSVHFSAVDIDPTQSNFEWSMETNATWLSLDGNHMHGIPTNGDVGIYEVNITLRDGDGGSAWRYFTVEVINTNDDPYFIVDPFTRATEDEYYNTTLEAEDPDPTNDVLTWSLDQAPDFLSIDPETGRLFGTPTNEDVGSWDIIVTVSDGNSGMGTMEFEIMVVNTNDDPTIITEPITEIEEDEEYFLRLVATDIDPGVTTFQWALDTNASWLSLDVDTLEGVPDNSDIGSFYVNITVYDGDHGTDHLFFIIKVSNTNDQPIIISDPIAYATEDELYTMQVEVEDVDEGDSFKWTLSAPDWLNIDPDTGLVNGTPTNEDVGQHWIKITVTDLAGETDSMSFMLVVQNTNDAPTWNRVPGDRNMTEEELLTDHASAEDPDDNIVTYSISSTPELAISINPDTGMIICNRPQPGSYVVTVTASDGTETIEMTFNVNVSEVPEMIIPTDETDTDSDGMPDWWEDLYDLDPEDPSDAGEDLDGDGITNLEEFTGRTSPTEDNSEPEEKGTSPIFFIIIAILAILAIVFLALFLLKGSGKNRTEPVNEEVQESNSDARTENNVENQAEPEEQKEPESEQ